MLKELDNTSYYYRQLKSRFPNENVFYVEEDEGDYYNRARTVFYDSNKKELETKVHDYYG